PMARGTALPPSIRDATPGNVLRGSQGYGRTQPVRRQGPPNGITLPHGLTWKVRTSSFGPFSSTEYIVPCIPVKGSTRSTVNPFRYLSAYAWAATFAFSSVSEGCVAFASIIPGQPVAPIMGPIIPGPIPSGVGPGPRPICAPVMPATKTTTA